MARSLIGRLVGSFRRAPTVRSCSTQPKLPPVDYWKGAPPEEYWYKGADGYMYTPPEDTGVDYKHWLIHVDEPRGTRDQMISRYFNIVTSVLGSENEAKKAMYSVSTKYYFAIGVALDKDTAYKFREHPSVLNVVPDAYSDDINKDYGGEPVVDGQVAPYHPKHHDLYHRGQEEIRKGMIKEGIRELPGQATYERLLKQYKSDKDKMFEDASKPKKPPTAYSLFMKDYRKKYKEHIRIFLDAPPLGEAGRYTWRSMPYEERTPYLCVADIMKMDYQRAIKAYEKKQAGGNDDKDENDNESNDENDAEESDKSQSKEEDDG